MSVFLLKFMLIYIRKCRPTDISFNLIKRWKTSIAKRVNYCITWFILKKEEERRKEELIAAERVCYHKQVPQSVI